MNTVDIWPLAFPQPKAEAIVQLLVDRFGQLVNSKHGGFSYSLTEPKITEILAVNLQRTAARDIQPGQWQYEPMSNTLKLDDRRRRDIVFTTVYNNKESVSLIFECKKIDPVGKGSRRNKHLKEYRIEGIDRFASGSYAYEDPLGFMVSFSANSAEGTVAEIQACLADEKWAKAAHMHEFSKGVYWRAPPSQFAATASFETQHDRQSPYPYLFLYHLNLPFS